ncbi:hypothetical protein KBY55_04875 [Streptomyces sp. b94]|nr:hypothetical protein [Streptomyces sp. b94]
MSEQVTTMTASGGEGVLDTGADHAVLRVVLLLAPEQRPSGAFAVRAIRPVLM